MGSRTSIPLFPLHTVLFTGGVLTLQIFEPRYLSMISTVVRNGTGFGVVLIRDGVEVGKAASFHEVGSIAVLDDFERLENGCLGITCHGEDRFRVISHSVRDDQLIMADVEILEEQEARPDSEYYSELRNYVHRLFQREDCRGWCDSDANDWDNGHWLTCRLIEILPLTVGSLQSLLEMEVEDRLFQLSRIIAHPI